MNEFNAIIEELYQQTIAIEPITLSEIPDIDLYMDQITTFIDTKLGGLKRYSEDKVLTKTMINNYTKAKLFPPPVKKKYTKNHIMLFILIYHLKSFLSIRDISKLLKPITEELKAGEQSKTLEIVYEQFVMLGQNQEFTKEEDGRTIQELQKIVIENNMENTEQIKLIVMILLLAAQANTKKRLAEKILDVYF